MPGESRGEQGATERRTSNRATDDSWKPPAELIDQLRPWIDLDRVDAASFHEWLSAVLPLFPQIGREELRTGGDATARIRQLSQALARAAGEQARSHFQASEYFRENQLLTRRLLALEAMLRTRKADLPERSREESAALEHYLPKKRSP